MSSWLVKARRTQRFNYAARWFYIVTIAANVILSYVGDIPWVSRTAALLLLGCLIINEQFIHMLDQAIKEVNDDTSDT